MHFTQDQVQTLAALFHDIATPVFFHAVDFVYGDYEKQETTEERTEIMIRSDQGIMKQLEKDGIDEPGFLDENTACKFAFYALECGKIYSGDENRFAMEQLAGIIRNALKRGILCKDDLYTTEADVIAKLKTVGLRNEFEKFERFNQVVVCDASDPHAVCVNAKKRYVDPLCKSGKRISAIRPELKEEIRRFVSLDYRYYVKGVINE